MNYLIKDTTLTAIGDAVRAKGNTEDKILVSDLATAISNLPTGGGETPEIVISGNASQKFYSNKESLALTYFPECIRTENLTDCYQMFYGVTQDKIPFDLNGKVGTTCRLQQIFSGSNIKEYPAMYNFKPSATQYLFSAYYTRYLPKGIDTWDWSYFNTGTEYCSSCFYGSYSLREIPKTFLSNYWRPHASNGANGNIYYSLFENCYCLDEVNGIPIATKQTSTGAGFINTFYRCWRLKNITFQMEDGVTPKTTNWTGYTIDLSAVGFAETNYSKYILNYNSGITADKQVTNDATYQALKDDPDWWSTNYQYSRYNRDSAVNTINSLPDCSATGTNTIKFKGEAGSKTDGGAINTLTEEEIAVATAKGWTVSLA